MNFLKSVILGVLTILFAVQSFAGSDEVKGCLNQGLNDKKPIYQVPQGANSPLGFDRYLAILCKGDPAKALYNSVKDAATAGDWAGKKRGDVKIIGEQGGSSMCYHVTRNSEGENVDQYSCSIRLNVSEKILGKTTIDEMVPFELKADAVK